MSSYRARLPRTVSGVHHGLAVRDRLEGETPFGSSSMPSELQRSAQTEFPEMPMLAP